MNALLLILLHFTPPAAAQISVLVDSPHERRSLVEIAEPERLSYRLCHGSHVTVDNLLDHCRRLGPDLPNTPEVREHLRAEFTRALADSLAVYAYETSAQTVGLHVLRDSLVYTGVQLALIGFFRGPLKSSEWIERVVTSYLAWLVGNGVINGGTAWGRRRHLATLFDVQDQVARADGSKPAVVTMASGMWPAPSTEMQMLANAMRQAVSVTYAKPIVDND